MSSQAQSPSTLKVPFLVLRMIAKGMFRAAVPTAVRDFVWVHAAPLSRCEDCDRRGSLIREGSAGCDESSRSESCEHCGSSGNPS